MTSSAVCSVTAAPPTLLMYINRQWTANEKMKGNGVLCVNLLAHSHQALAERFADHSIAVAERFGESELWTSGTTGAPALIGATAALDCRISSVTEVGSHSVFFPEVVPLSLSPSPESLVYFDRSFHTIARAGANVGEARG